MLQRGTKAATEAELAIINTQTSRGTMMMGAPDRLPRGGVRCSGQCDVCWMTAGIEQVPEQPGTTPYYSSTSTCLLLALSCSTFCTPPLSLREREEEYRK